MRTTWLPCGAASVVLLKSPVGVLWWWPLTFESRPDAARAYAWAAVDGARRSGHLTHDLCSVG